MKSYKLNNLYHKQIQVLTIKKNRKIKKMILEIEIIEEQEGTLAIENDRHIQKFQSLDLDLEKSEFA